MAKTPSSSAGGVGSNPGQRIKVPHALGCGQKNSRDSGGRCKFEESF